MQAADIHTTGFFRASMSSAGLKELLSLSISPSNFGMNKKDRMARARMKVPRKMRSARTPPSIESAKSSMIHRLMNPTTSPAAP